jgi:hypothetical protein
MNNKPKVIPTKEQIDAAKAEKAKIEAYEREKLAVTQEIYGSQYQSDTPQGHLSAVEMMQQRTFNQLNQYQEKGVVEDPNLAEKPITNTVNQYIDANKTKNEEQIALRDKQLKMNQEQTKRYQEYSNNVSSVPDSKPNYQTNMNNYQPNVSQPMNQTNQFQSFGQIPSDVNPYILELSQPNYNAPFDVIPLPSQGKLYRNKKSNIRVAYLTTADENILTSPNLLQSGEFLEILINRKILEPELRYKDLLPGDRNAIMIWLRATGYGEMYPVTLLDELDEPFETEINLNELKTKELTVEPDEEGLFTFQLPLSKVYIKFRLLTCGDIDAIDKMVERDAENEVPVNNSNTYRLERMIVEVNGTRDRGMIKDYVSSIRIPDYKALVEFMDSIESGIDLNIEVKTPGGGSVATFLPLNLNFFWPNLRL